MNKLMRSQNGCSFGPPSSAARSLYAGHPGSPRKLLVLLASQSVSGSGPVLRAIKNSYGEVLREFPENDGEFYMAVVKLPVDEADRWNRLVEAKNLFPEVILDSSLELLPLLPQVLDAKPVGEDRHLLLMGFDEDAAPKSDILELVSAKAHLNVSYARREMNPLGVGIILVASGRAEPIAIIEELNCLGQFPSRQRAGVIVQAKSFDHGCAQPAPYYSDEDSDILELQFKESLPDQLRPFIAAIGSLPGPGYNLYASNCKPKSGVVIGAIALIKMCRRQPSARIELEQRVRELALEHQVQAHAWWSVDGIRYQIADIG